MRTFRKLTWEQAQEIRARYLEVANYSRIAKEYGVTPISISYIVRGKSHLIPNAAGEGHKTHGMTNTRMYSIWIGMRRRCYDKRYSRYYDYGGRGIVVCDRWQKFEAFAADVGPHPGPEWTLDRIDNNGNYEPGNVRWATRRQQALNRRPKSHVRGKPISARKSRKKGSSDVTKTRDIEYVTRTGDD